MSKYGDVQDHGRRTAGGTEYIETVIIGGGQAGLSVGYQLAGRHRPFAILDANERIGDAWRTRWNSLRLFTSARRVGSIPAALAADFTVTRTDDPSPGAYELVTCQGAAVNMVGTAGADVLRSGDRSDAILGLGGRDEICGGDGNDSICAGEGNDRLTGGSGNDRLFGQRGQDVLDTRDGVKGNDVADGGSGQDTCRTDLQDRRISC